MYPRINTADKATNFHLPPYPNDIAVLPAPLFDIHFYMTSTATYPA